MAILVSPDSRGRLNLSRVVQDKQYAVEVDENGVITLTPSVVVSEQDFEALTAVRPVLTPDEAFGFLGSVEAAQAVLDNRAARSAGQRGTRIATKAALHSLIWGDAA